MIQFGYRSSAGDISAGTLVEWNDITQHASPYGAGVRRALRLLGEGKLT